MTEAEWVVRFDALLEKYHTLALRGPIATDASVAVVPPVTFPEPDMPPAVVLAAMQTISPTRDRTYEANWAHWERNKAKAEAHPEAFAEEIIAGNVDWTTQTR